MFDGKYATAAGVPAGLDMALAIAGNGAAQAIQLAHEYDPRPPYRAGTPARAPRAGTEVILARRDGIIH